MVTFSQKVKEKKSDVCPLVHLFTCSLFGVGAPPSMQSDGMQSDESNLKILNQHCQNIFYVSRYFKRIKKELKEFNFTFSNKLVINSLSLKVKRYKLRKV